MRKAFDANVPKFRPRLKTATTPGEAGQEPAAQTPPGGDQAAEAPPAAPATLEGTAPEAPPAVERSDGAGEPANGAELPLALSVAREEKEGPEPAASETPPPAEPELHAGGGRAPALRNGSVTSPPPEAAAPEVTPREPAPAFPFDESLDVQARRERLMQVKRKVAAAARPAPVMPALPEAPARAGESALALVRDLEAQLQRARDVESALRADLDQARAELVRGAAESRRTAERLAAVEHQVEEKRAVLQEMLAEMSALEEERDGAVARAQALTALDEERQALLDGLSARAEQAEKGRAEAQAEVDRLGDELDERASDAARLRAALAQVTRERDDLAREVAEARRERDELAEARKALEQVHEALATARARLG